MSLGLNLDIIKLNGLLLEILLLLVLVLEGLLWLGWGRLVWIGSVNILSMEADQVTVDHHVEIAINNNEYHDLLEEGSEIDVAEGHQYQIYYH